MMEIKRILTSCNHEITVVDNLFNFLEIESFYLFATKLNYNFNNSKHGQFFNCRFNENNELEFNFNTNKNLLDEFVFLNDYKRYDSWIDAVLPNSRLHKQVGINSITPTTEQNKTILYHVNKTWDNNCGGEILFSSISGETEIALEFCPGRIIIIDSILPFKQAYSAHHNEPKYLYVSKYRKIR